MDAKLTLILLFLLALSPVSAKFICGEVYSNDEVSPSWYGVSAVLASNENKNSSCQVSPLSNKYCCELNEDSMRYKWKSGDVFGVKITDASSGYFAAQKNLTLTGQGYDVALNLTLEKAIRINSPKSSLIISEKQIQIKQNISKNCQSQLIENQFLSFGENIVEISANCNGENFDKFYLKKFKKSNDVVSIRNKKSGEINLNLELSYKVRGVELKEYVPSSWEILEISNNGTLKKFSSKYNVIIWNLNGKKFDFNYKVKSPSVGIWPKHFTFKTELEEYLLGEKSIQVYKFIPLPMEEIIDKGGWVYNPQKYSKVSEVFPMLFRDEGLTAALYSSQPMNKEAFDMKSVLLKKKIDRKYVYLKSYQVRTTLNETESSKFALEYKTNKTFLEKNNYRSIEFFKEDAKGLVQVENVTVSLEEKDNIKYSLELEFTPDYIYIFAEKKSLTFWDKVVNLWYKIF